MHDERLLIEERIERELWERVLPLAHADRRPVEVSSGPSPDELEPLADRRWGVPWATTWFRFDGEIPASWRNGRVEAVIDLGFHPDAAGFQCEGLVVDSAGRPVQGIHPRRTTFRLAGEPGPVSVLLEAASNPSFPTFRPSAMGSPETAGTDPIYRFRRAELVLVDPEAEALVHDLDVLDGVMRSLPLTDPRRGQLLSTLAAALDAVPDVGRARELLQPALAAPARAGAHRIMAVGHAHIDTAWLWPMGETVRKCTRTFASSVRLLDDHPDHRFVCSQAQQYAWIEERHPDLFTRIAAHVDAGQWIPVGGMWVESDMNLPSGESLARQIVFGQRYFEDRFGVRCTEMWIPDVFGYPAGLPQLFAAGGMNRFVTQKLSWNRTNRFPHHTFWWEGLDGTRVLTHFPPVDTYNAQITPAECAEASERFAEHRWSRWSLAPFGYGDGGGGPTAEMLERARRLADLDGAPRVEIGTPARFFDEVEREASDGAPVPVWRGELYFETHRGTLTSQLRTKVGSRRCERLLRELELWSTALGQQAGVDHLWREVLTLQFHDILPGSSIAWVHAEAEEAFTRIALDLTDRIERVTDRLAPPEPTVVNPAGVARHEVIVAAAFAAEDASSGGSSPVQALADGSRAAWVAVGPSAMAIARPGPVADAVVVGARSLSNGSVDVRFDDAGTISSFVDRSVAAAREIVPAGSRAALLTIAPDHPVRYDAWDLESWTPGLAEVLSDPVSITIIDAGPLIGRIRVDHEFGPSRAGITYTLRAGSPRLDIAVELDWHHSEHLLSMVFPLDIRADTAACDIQFGHVRRPTHPSTSWDAARFEVCAHRFVDVAEPGFGVAVLNDGRYGHGLFGGTGMDAGGVRVSLARAARYPDPHADQGHHEVTLALFPHGTRLADVVAEAERFNEPVRVVTGHADGPAESVIVIDGGGVRIDAVKMADDGRGDRIVRFHEACGDRRRVTVRGAVPIGSAQRSNLLEEADPSLGPGVEVVDGSARLTLRPFELVTLRLGSVPGVGS